MRPPVPIRTAKAEQRALQPTFEFIGKLGRELALTEGSPVLDFSG